MKLAHKIIFGNILAIVFIATVYAFSSQKFDLVLNKLSFVEIAEGLNTNLLRMRLSEKNYFLYKDKSDLPLIREDLRKSAKAIDTERVNLTHAIGGEKYGQLKSNLKKYEQEVAALEIAGEYTKVMEESLRETGRQLREQSANLIRLERANVNQIIKESRRALFSFFCFVLAIAATTSYLFFSKMFRSLRRIEKVAMAISKGNFNKIKSKIPNDELGSVMRAINSMSEELGSRLDQLTQSRKLASMGVLTAGVAHELGNPLNNISMVAQNYIELYDHMSPEERLDYMQTVLEQTERIRSVVQNLLDFSKPKQDDFQLVNLNQLAKDSLKLVKNMFDVTCIESKLELEPALPPVRIDKHKIQEVLVNLLTNAVHALSCGGTVYIRTKLEEKEEYVIIEVEDTGDGISAEFLPHIFDPFFSTKGTEGTGLGLSISYGIIKSHNGQIDVKSRVGGGTTFIIHLPVYRQEDI